MRPRYGSLAPPIQDRTSLPDDRPAARCCPCPTAEDGGGDGRADAWTGSGRADRSGPDRGGGPRAWQAPGLTPRAEACRAAGLFVQCRPSTTSHAPEGVSTRADRPRSWPMGRTMDQPVSHRGSDTVVSPALFAPASEPVVDPLEPAVQLLRDLSSGAGGLSERGAAPRLGRFGPNELRTRAAPTWPWALVRQFTPPLAVLLMLATVLAFVAGIAQLG